MSSSPINLPWTRLVRYSSSADGPVKYGEPVSSPNVDLEQLASKGELKVKQLSGSDPFSLQTTSVHETVFRLYGPLEVKHIPIIRCIGLNYKTHTCSQYLRPADLYPLALPSSPSRVRLWRITANPFLFPKSQNQCDYEGELVIVIGRDGKNISEADALDYVAGYTVGNDVSARDWQREADEACPVPQWGFSKSFDKYAPHGPCIVNKDQLKEANDLSLRTLVNGEVRQESHTSDLCFGVRKLVAFCSQGQTLQRGSLIMTGTPGGVGLFTKPPAFLKDGDEVKVEIENIGTLRNTMAFEK